MNKITNKQNRERRKGREQTDSCQRGSSWGARRKGLEGLGKKERKREEPHGYRQCLWRLPGSGCWRKGKGGLGGIYTDGMRPEMG